MKLEKHMHINLLSKLHWNLKINQLTKKILDQDFYIKEKAMKQKFGNLSFSQSGEDLIVDYIFKLRGINYPSYIDIGANDPFYLSNTALFYLKGSRGINVEANPNLIEKFFKFRSEDVNLNYGVAAIDGVELDFFILSEPTLSTFSNTEMETYVRTGKYKLVETEKIKTYTFEYLLRVYGKGIIPDFMSIDIEGFDFEIIQSINFDVFAPKVICIEAYDYSPTGSGRHRKELIEYIVSKQYHEYADTGLNSILVKKDFWFV